MLGFEWDQPGVHRAGKKKAALVQESESEEEQEEVLEENEEERQQYVHPHPYNAAGYQTFDSHRNLFYHRTHQQHQSFY